MHDDGRYDDPRVTGSTSDPVSRETDYPGWSPGATGGSTRPTGGDPLAARDDPAVHSTGSETPEPTAGRRASDGPSRPVNAAEVRQPLGRRNTAAAVRFEPAVPHQPTATAARDAAPVVPDAPVASTESLAAVAADPTYVSRETPTREEDDPPLAMEAMRAVQILNPSGEVTMPRPDRTRVMCVANQKGGVGKTTTTVNLAVALALHGNRVLVVDLDPQGNASTGLNVPHHTGIPDVYDCLINSVPLSEVAQAVEGIPNLWCVPATIDLAGAEIELVSVVARESRLDRAIAAYPGQFDYVFIDCPPSLGLLTVNALVAAQEVLIPIQCEYYALEGLNQLINNINLVRQHLNPKLDVSTILLTMYDRRTRLADAVEQDVRNHFGDKVLQAVIPRNVRVSEAPSYGQSVMTYDPGSRGATSYFEAAQEIAERGVKEPVGRNA
ncbi:ParA family protein [Micromonospora lupini]|uniref:ParA family protein n=1 Tax=Micromonospora lupini TaxID=285679 RepID=UPI0031D0FFCA